MGDRRRTGGGLSGLFGGGPIEARGLLEDANEGGKLLDIVKCSIQDSLDELDDVAMRIANNYEVFFAIPV